MIVNTNPDFYKLFKSCVRWRDPSHTPAFLIIIIHEGGKPVKSETGFFWGEGGCFFVADSTCRCCIRCGGLPGWLPVDLAAVVSAGVACLLCRLLPLPLVVFVAPIPPTPFPAGRGRLKVYFAGGYRPRHPGIKPSTALTAPATQAPLRGSGLFSTRIPVAPVCAIALFNAERTGFPQAKPVPRPHPARGCKGRSPLHEITLVSPFPLGRGLGGWGKESKLKAGLADGKQNKSPPDTAAAGQQAAKSASP